MRRFLDNEIELGPGNASGGEIYLPSEFSMTLGLFDSMIATQELVVPKSIPMVLKRDRIRPIFESFVSASPIDKPER